MFILLETGDFMKKTLLLFTILFMSVVTSACINNFAIQELNNKAESYMDKGDTETAICRLKSSLDLDNEVYQTHYNLAVAYTSIGKFEDAVKELEKVQELKPDFADAYYTMAVAKEALAYQIIDKDSDDNTASKELTKDEIESFNNKAADVIEVYNEYLVKKENAPEAQQINDKISELNQKIKDYTEIYDKMQADGNEQIQNELNSDEGEQG